jgi:hypothetical protein
MENQFKIETEKVESSKILEIIRNYKDSSNKDLALALQYVEKDFNYTKETLLKMSDHLDKLEYTYNLLHKEFYRVMFFNMFI